MPKSESKSITLMGLGIMGRAVAESYSKQGYQVHGWNRGKANRERTQAMNLPNVIIYEDPDEAVQQSDGLILMTVLADEMLATAESVIRTVDPKTWKERTLVQFTSHEPFAIKAQEKLMMTLQANLIGGAMMAVPSTVGSDAGIFLVSSRDSDLLHKNLPDLEVLGTVVPFEGDIGLASLADIGLLQALQFGLAGNELSCYIFQRYGVDQKFRDTYIELIPKTTVPIFETLSHLAGEAVFCNDYQEQAKVYTAAGHLAVYEAHQYFFERMGLEQPTYLSVYLEQFRKVKGSEGPAAIVDTYTFSVKDDK